MQLSKITKRRLELGLRTAYTSSLTLLIYNFYAFADTFSYLGGVLAVISNPVNVGLWIDSFWQVVNSTLVGSLFGTIISVTWSISPSLQLFLMFIAITVVNRITAWERLSKVIGSLTCLLATVFPNLTHGRIEGFAVFYNILLMALIPYSLTGFSLCFPIVKLASSESIKEINVISHHFKRAIEQLIHGFKSGELADLNEPEINLLFKEVDNSLVRLKTLAKCSVNEAIFIPSGNLAASINCYLHISERLLYELRGVQSMLRHIPRNITQELFAIQMQDELSQLSHESRLALRLVEDHFSSLKVRPIVLTKNYIVFIFCNILYCRSESIVQSQPDPTNIDPNDELCDTFVGRSDRAVSFPDIERSIRLNEASAHLKGLSSAFLQYKRAVERLSLTKRNLLERFREMRSAVISCVRMKDVPQQKFTRVQISKWSSWKPSSNSPSTRSNFTDEKDSNLDSDSISMTPIMSSRELSEAEIETIQSDCTRWSINNLSPRGAYLGRLFLVMESISNLHEIFQAESESFLFYQFCKSTVQSYVPYTIESMKEIYQLCVAVIVLLFATPHIIYEMYNGRVWKSKESSLNRHWSLFRMYVQPMKIAGSIAITSTLIVSYDQTQDSFLQNATWAAAGICFIRQDSSLSSFMTSYQRIEGTLVGAIYGYAIFQLLLCQDDDSEYCSNNFILPLLVVWIAICACFKEGPRHGYSAVVSALTPISIMLLPTTLDAEAAWRRITMQFIGVAIYLVIDITILPNRADTIARKSMLVCVDEYSKCFKNSVRAVDVLFGMFKIISRMESIHPFLTKENDSCDTSNRKSAIKNGDQIMKDQGGNTPSDQRAPAEKSTELVVEQELDCMNYLDAALESTKLISALLNKVDGALSLADQEPDIFFNRPFPMSDYVDLACSFRRVGQSIYCLIASTRALLNAMHDMSAHQEDVALYLRTFGLISSLLSSLSLKASDAIEMASVALHKLVEEHDGEVNMTSLVYLGRHCDRLLLTVEDHWRTRHLIQTQVADTNPLFVITWQNVFESLSSLVRDISDLGRSLVTITKVDSFGQRN